MLSLILSIERASSRSLAVRGSIVKMRFYLKSLLNLISSSGIFHSPEVGSRFLVKTLRDSWTFSLSFCPSASYSSDQMSWVFRILRLSAFRLPASPMCSIMLQTGLMYPTFQLSNLAI
jgi:hypothetical protein